MKLMKLPGPINELKELIKLYKNFSNTSTLDEYKKVNFLYEKWIDYLLYMDEKFNYFSDKDDNCDDGIVSNMAEEFLKFYKKMKIQKILDCAKA